MNKRIILTSLVFLVAGSLYNLSISANDLKNNSLVGKVKEVLTSEIMPADKGMTSIRTFDEHGNLTKEVIKGANDKTVFISTFEPFENGKFVEYINFNEEGIVNSKESMRLDVNGEVLSMKSFNGQNELISSVSSHFDKQGNVTSTKEFDSTNKLVASKIYSYDGYGRLSYIKSTPQLGESFYEFFSYTTEGKVKEHKSVTASGDVLNQTITEFDDEGNKIKTILYPSLKSSAEHQVSEYDQEGRLVSSSFVTGDDVVIHKEEYTYLKTGLKSKSSVYDLVDDVLITSYIINYDDKGNEVSRVNYDDKGIPSFYIETSYEYDEQGNWLVKTERNNDEVLSVTKREIAYY